MNIFGYSLVRTADYKELMQAYARCSELKEKYRTMCVDFRSELAKRNGDLAWQEKNAELSTELGYLRSRIGQLYAAFHDMEKPIDEVIVELDMLANEASSPCGVVIPDKKGEAKNG